MNEPIVATVADAYHLLEEIGSGGAGSVWRSRATDGRIVAVKLLKKLRLGNQASVKERFLDEVQAGRVLRNKHIVELLDHGEIESLGQVGCHNGAYFLVFEYVTGGTLRDRLEEGRYLTSEEIWLLASAIGSALRLAHQTPNPFIHRDIKPANILLPDGDVAAAKLIDFGLARRMNDRRLTSTGIRVGTPLYIAPEEVLADHAPAPSTDQFALALTLWEALTGEVPGGKTTEYETVQARSGSDILEGRELHFDDEHAPHTTAVFLRALQSSPADRYASVDSFLRALYCAGIRDSLGWSATDSADVRELFGIVTDNNGRVVSFSSAGLTEDDATALVGASFRLSKAATVPSLNGDHGRVASRTKQERNQRSSSRSAFNKSMKISSALASVIGAESRPRTEVTSAIWTYIKKHDLQDPDNKSMVLTDDKLRIVCGGRRSVTMFEMTALVSKHLS